MNATRLPGSFRDPAGHIVVRDRDVFRHVTEAGREDYLQLMGSGLCAALVAARQLIPHDDLGHPPDAPAETWRVLRPERLPMISYAHEWAFSQLQDAALLTLAIQRLALASGMSLKDATSSNVQFHRGRPILIDTLSFERRPPGPWRAYRQFCQEFHAPLALMAWRDVRLGELLEVYPHGVPLDLASRILPTRSWFRSGALMHLHLHARAERQSPQPAPAARKAAGAGARDLVLEPLLDSLERAVRSLRWTPAGGWTRYDETRPSYTEAALRQKEEIVGAWIEQHKPEVVWDLGANTGRFSRLAARHGALAVAFDQDPGCVELAYLAARRDGLECVLPLRTDLTRPSPGLGWANDERRSLAARGPADLLLALALVHHLAIGNNVPLPLVAEQLALLGRALIIEFVPKNDPMVQRLLVARDDIFPHYTAAGFEAAFASRFRVERREALAESGRVLYLMSRT